MHPIRKALLALVVVFLTACSEGRVNTDTGPDTSAPDSAPLDATVGDGGGDTGAPPDTGVSPDTSPPIDGGSSGLVINEIEPDADWFEIYNAGASPVLLTGLSIADDDGMGNPRVDRAAALPDYALNPGDFFVATDRGDMAMPGLQMDAACDPPGGAVTRCVHTDWGASAGSGEVVYLLDAEGTVVDSLEMPGMDAVGAGQSWCRLPDGSGTGQVCSVQTAGAANSDG